MHVAHSTATPCAERTDEAGSALPTPGRRVWLRGRGWRRTGCLMPASDTSPSIYIRGQVAASETVGDRSWHEVRACSPTRRCMYPAPRPIAGVLPPPKRRRGQGGAEMLFHCDQSSDHRE